MIHWRNRLTPAIAALAGLFLLIAFFDHPPSLPPNSAQYQAAAIPRIADDATRKATVGVTFAFDTIEADGAQYPITGAKFRTRSAVIVRGWAVLPESLAPGRALLVTVDRQGSKPDSSYGMARPDVGTAINPKAVNSGFAAHVDVSHLAPGLHSVHFALENAAGVRIDLPQAVRFTLL